MPHGPMNRRSRGRRLQVLVLGAVGALACVRPASGQCPDGTPPPCVAPAPRAPASNSVAVLFFQSLSRDTADIFLADGLTEELITRLSQVRRLEVKSRFASERVRVRRAENPGTLGRAVGAAYLVTGSLQHVGERVRLNVALVRARTGAQVWADVYERAGDLLAIQAEIAREVAGAITGRLLPRERATLARVPTRDPVAYTLYLRGIGAANTSSESGLRAGLEYLDRAIERDSSFADAFVQKSVIWFMLADGYVEGRTAVARMRESAERALRLDSTRADAYAMLASAAITLVVGADSGQRLAERALRLDPNSAWAHDALSFRYLCVPGREDSVEAEARRGWEADTLSALSAMPYLWELTLLRRFDTLDSVVRRMGAVLASEDVRELDGIVRLARGEPRVAADRLSWSYYGGLFSGEYVRAQLAVGRRDAARAAVDSMVALSGRGFYNAFGVARAFAALGEADSAFAWLDRAWEQGAGWLVGLRHYVEFEPLHADPRWAALLRRMGLEP